MSAFGDPSVNPGLTPEQIAGLVTDGELSAAETALLTAIVQRADQASVNALGTVLAAKSTTAQLTATETALLAAIQAIPLVTGYATADALAALSTSVLAAINARATATALAQARADLLDAGTANKNAVVAAISAIPAPTIPAGLALTTDVTAAQAALVADAHTTRDALTAALGAKATAANVNDAGAAVSAQGVASEAAIKTSSAAEHGTTRTAVNAARDAVKAHVDGAKQAILDAQATAAGLANARTDILAGQGTLATSAQLTAARDRLESLQATAVALAGVRTDVLAGQGVLATAAQVTAARASIESLQATAVGQAAEHTSTRSVITVARDSLLTAITTARDFVVSAVNAARDAVLGAQATAVALASVRTDVLAGQGVLATSAQVTAARASIESLQATAAALSGVRTDILAAVTSSSAYTGEIRRFPANQVPAAFTRMADTGVMPAGGAHVVATAASAASAAGDAVYVAGGTNPGIWRYSNNVLQRFDVASGTAVGPAYPCPTAGSTQRAPAMTVLGTKIYLGGLATTSNVGTVKAYMFETTGTPAFSEVASFPKTLSGSRAVTLADGRILITSWLVAGAVVAPVATPFWIYDPVANLTPVEVSVALLLTKFSDANLTVMQMLPSGKVLLSDFASPAAGNILSCLLTVTGNAIAVSATEDTGLLATTGLGLMPTATGILTTNPSFRAYTEGSGWTAGSCPAAYGYAGALPGTSLGGAGQRTSKIEGLGWLFAGNATAAAMNVGILFTAAPGAGTVIVDAKKN